MMWSYCFYTAFLLVWTDNLDFHYVLKVKISFISYFRRKNILMFWNEIDENTKNLLENIIFRNLSFLKDFSSYVFFLGYYCISCLPALQGRLWLCFWRWNWRGYNWGRCRERRWIPGVSTGRYGGTAIFTARYICQNEVFSTKFTTLIFNNNY